MEEPTWESRVETWLRKWMHDLAHVERQCLGQAGEISSQVGIFDRKQGAAQVDLNALLLGFDNVIKSPKGQGWTDENLRNWQGLQGQLQALVKNKPAPMPKPKPKRTRLVARTRTARQCPKPAAPEPRPTAKKPPTPTAIAAVTKPPTTAVRPETTQPPVPKKGFLARIFDALYIW